MGYAPVLPETTFREMVEQLRNNVIGVRAIVLVAPDGQVPFYFADDPTFRVETFTPEYAMLLRIASHTSDDVGFGSLAEHIAVSELRLTIARRLPSNSFLVLVSDRLDQLGRARYEMRRAAALL
jgi:predicted regulator of Ras-like GTPase activity (Roadblock/LC7/MglB family)